MENNERLLFEKWYATCWAWRLDRLVLEPWAGQYRDLHPQLCWEVWQARASLDTRGETQTDLERIEASYTTGSQTASLPLRGAFGKREPTAPTPAPAPDAVIASAVVRAKMQSASLPAPRNEQCDCLHLRTDHPFDGKCLHEEMVGDKGMVLACACQNFTTVLTPEPAKPSAAPVRCIACGTVLPHHWQSNCSEASSDAVPRGLPKASVALPERPITRFMTDVLNHRCSVYDVTTADAYMDAQAALIAEAQREIQLLEQSLAVFQDSTQKLQAELAALKGGQ